MVIGRGPPGWPGAQASQSILGPPVTAVRLVEEVPEQPAARVKLAESNGFFPTRSPGSRRLRGQVPSVFSGAYSRASGPPALYNRRESRTH